MCVLVCGMCVCAACSRVAACSCCRPRAKCLSNYFAQLSAGGHVSSFCHTAETTRAAAAGRRRSSRGEERRQHRSLFVCACQTAAAGSNSPDRHASNMARHASNIRQAASSPSSVNAAAGGEQEKKTVAEINVANLQVRHAHSPQSRLSAAQALPPSLPSITLV